MAFLEEAIRTEAAQSPKIADHIEVRGRLSLRLAQSEEWRRIVDVAAAPESAKTSKKDRWGKLPAWLAVLAEAKLKGAVELEQRSREGLNSWFDERTDERRYERAYDPRFTADEMVSIAEVRAHWLFGITDPWQTIRSIRWPDLVKINGSDAGH